MLKSFFHPDISRNDLTNFKIEGRNLINKLINEISKKPHTDD